MNGARDFLSNAEEIINEKYYEFETDNFEEEIVYQSEQKHDFYQ